MRRTDRWTYRRTDIVTNGREHLTWLLTISQCLGRGRNIGWSKKSNETHFISALTSREDNPLRFGYDILGQINFDAPSVPLHERVSACFHEISQRVTRYWRGFDSFKKHARAWWLQIWASWECPSSRHMKKKIQIFRRGLRNSISQCVGRSVRLSVGLLVGPPFPFSVFLAFCEQFFHHCSCPIKRDWGCRVYGTPHCPPHNRSCPTPAT